VSFLFRGEVVGEADALKIFPPRHFISENCEMFSTQSVPGYYKHDKPRVGRELLWLRHGNSS
jgi:hypothetical protein